MKFCSKCGNQLLDEAVICPKCGCQVTDFSMPKVEKIKPQIKANVPFDKRSIIMGYIFKILVSLGLLFGLISIVSVFIDTKIWYTYTSTAVTSIKYTQTIIYFEPICASFSFVFCLLSLPVSIVGMVFKLSYKGKNYQTIFSAILYLLIAILAFVFSLILFITVL